MELSDYPKTILLGDRIELQIRPLQKADQKNLHDYFLRLPSVEVSRLKNDVTDPGVVESWIYDLDYDVTLPLVALNGGQDRRCRDPAFQHHWMDQAPGRDQVYSGSGIPEDWSFHRAYPKHHRDRQSHGA